jgi:hypothetical protein
MGARQESCSIRARAGQDFVLLNIHRARALGKCRIPTELANGAVELRQMLRDQLTLGIVPWSASDAIPRIYGRDRVRRFHTQVRTPSMVTRAFSLCQGLTVTVGACEPPEIPAFAETFAGHKEPRHRFVASHGNG